MASVGEILVRINGDNSGLNNSLKSAQSKMKNLGSGMTNVGKKMSMGITAPILAMGAGVIKVGMDFDVGMSKVKAVSGATGKQMVELRKKARDMGATTKFSATESAEAMNFMAMA